MVHGSLCISVRRSRLRNAEDVEARAMGLPSK
jgi:hypothetical protein